MTDTEKRVVREIGHPIYTVEYLEEWINRNENVFINAPAALLAMGAKGFYEAVEILAKREEAGNEKTTRQGK